MSERPSPMEQPPELSLPERLRNLRGDIVGLLSGEKKPPAQQEPRLTDLSISAISLDTQVMTLPMRVMDEDGYLKDRLNMTASLTQVLSAETISVASQALGIEQPVSLSALTDEQALMQVKAELERVLGGRLTNWLDYPDNIDDLEVTMGQKTFRFDESFHPQQRGVRAAMQQAAQHYDLQYAQSPLQPYVHDLSTVLQKHIPNWGGKEVIRKPYTDALQESEDTILGSYDENGHFQPGTILQGDRTETLKAWSVWGADMQPLKSETPPPFEEAVKVLESASHVLKYRLINIGKSSENVLLLPQPEMISFERGKPPVESSWLTRGTKGISVGETNKRGEIPLQTDGRFISVTVSLTAEDARIEAYDLEAGKTVQTDALPATKTFTPWNQIAITEETTDGKTETYTLWRVNDGILLQCATADKPTFYPRDIVFQGRVTKKPVLYFYPTHKMNITTTLQYKGKLTNTYPKIDNTTWTFTASPDGTLEIGEKRYRYLFWEGMNQPVEWDWSKGFCIHRDEVEQFLEEKCALLGLNFAEAQDCITYWAPVMKQNTWSLVSFQSERYEELAKLMIFPRPDTLLRVFMVFQKVEQKIAIPEQRFPPVERTGFTVVEWGGSNLDERAVGQEKIG